MRASRLASSIVWTSRGSDDRVEEGLPRRRRGIIKLFLLPRRQRPSLQLKLGWVRHVRGVVAYVPWRVVMFDGCLVVVEVDIRNIVLFLP